MEWNLKIIYPTREDYLNDLKLVKEEINEIEAFQGKLTHLDVFVNYALLSKKLNEQLSKLFCYASMKHDLNQKDNDATKDYQEVYQVYNDYIAKNAFVEPEILAIGEEKVNQMVKKNKDLEPLTFYLKQLFRNQHHILDAKSELLMANDRAAMSGFNQLYDKLAVSDNQSVQVTVSTGETLTLTEANFQYYLGLLNNQEDRRIVFEAIYKFYKNHENTFAGIYTGIMESEYASMKNRGYNSILESRLDYNAIPKEVVLSLIDTARHHSEPLKEYYAFRKKYFGLKELHTYDRFLNFAESDKEYSYARCKEMVLDATKALGEDYYHHAVQALEDGRVSVETKDGKRTGAYSTSLYHQGSFILLNHNNNLDSAFTIAHECGHSIHSLYANENQPIETADYTIFVAEIASTFNEQLFLDYVMKHSSSKEEKIVVLQQAIDNIVATFYRQTLFADFELQAHSLVENQSPVTAEGLQKIMEDLYLCYFGIDLKKEPLKNNVWAYIPHFFHTPFYVYQYATSFAASLAIYEKVKNNEPHALENYIAMLSAGGSDYPVEIVKKGGVDLTKKEAFLAVVDRLSELVGLLKELLNQ